MLHLITTKINTARRSPVDIPRPLDLSSHPAELIPKVQSRASITLLAHYVFRLEKLRWVMETSRLNPGLQHKSTVTKMARTYKASIDTLANPGPVSRSPSLRAR